MISVKKHYFYLHTSHTSYVIRLLPDGTLNHCYYGKRIPEDDLDYYHLFIPHDITARLQVKEEVTTPDALPQECPGFGRGDFRRPAISVADATGREVNEYKYLSYRIVKGKPPIPGLPQLDVNVCKEETLEILMKDLITGVKVTYSYTAFYEEDVIARHTSIWNDTDQILSVQEAASATVDFETAGYDMVSLGGTWERERYVERYPLHYGEAAISSSRGLSGHHLNPFAALAKKDAGEKRGSVFGFALVYSGNFKISAEVGQFGGTRVWLGIHPELFSWELKPGETYVTPEALLTYSGSGFGGMSRNYHMVCRNHLGVCAKKEVEHPIVLNLWEAMHFDISEEKIGQVIEACSGLGIDTLVVDDGWFGCRNDETSSLGDWFVNTRKFPGGLNTVAEACRRNNLKLGIWLEPEMVSRNSEFFRQHPDWCIHIPDISPVEIRNQLMLDMSRKEVVDEVYRLVAKLLHDYDISYVKWDMNRSITDNGSAWLPAHRQKEHGHRYMLGVYELIFRLTKDFPHIFFEGCASGGGRFDFGILYYMPQIWTSDNTDALERMMIQYGTSFVYPPETMAAHVSACPNIGTGRTTPFQTRCDVAQFFSFGYELDVTKLSDSQRALVAEQTARHRRVAQRYAGGDFYRLRNPFQGNCCAWQMVSKDGSHSIVFYATKLKQPNFCGEYLRLKGLEDEKIFRVEPMEVSVSGAVLKHAGIPIHRQSGDFHTLIFELSELSDRRN